MNKLTKILTWVGAMALTAMPVLLLTGAVSTGPVSSSNPTGDGSGLTNTAIFHLYGGQTTAAWGTTGNAKFVPISSWGVALSTTAQNNWQKTPDAAIYTNLFVINESGIGAGTNFTYTVFTNGVATPLTVSFQGTGGQAAYSNTTVGVYIPRNVNMELMVSNNAASTPTLTIYWSVEGMR